MWSFMAGFFAQHDLQLDFQNLHSGPSSGCTVIYLIHLFIGFQYVANVNNFMINFLYINFYVHL